MYRRVGRLPRRRAWFLLAALAALAAGCGGPRPAHSIRARPGSSSPPTTVSTSSTTSTSTSTPTTTLPGEAFGRLPQTRAFPSTHSAQFLTEMKDLWRGVTTGSMAAAMQAFFPETAYDQVKAIADPSADWRDRLVFYFSLDVAAAHRYLRRDSSREKFLYVAVPSNEASWIGPGYCYNSVGYWHVPGARIVYKQSGKVRSIGIASMISWRGQWYVVHFGAVIPTTTGGTVESPASGEGTFPAPGGC